MIRFSSCDLVLSPDGIPAFAHVRHPGGESDLGFWKLLGKSGGATGQALLARAALDFEGTAYGWMQLRISLSPKRTRGARKNAVSSLRKQMGVSSVARRKGFRLHEPIPVEDVNLDSSKLSSVGKPV